MWCSDYGCSDQPEDFEYLIKYSPLHNIKKQKYPAILVTTADHDGKSFDSFLVRSTNVNWPFLWFVDRVIPGHSFKYIAELQHTANDVQGNILLIRVETKVWIPPLQPHSTISINVIFVTFKFRVDMVFDRCLKSSLKLQRSSHSLGKQQIQNGIYKLTLFLLHYLYPKFYIHLTIHIHHFHR